MATITKELGTNVKGSINGTKLTIEIDLTKDYGPSKSGKTLTVASTGGFVKLPGNEAIMMNLSVNRR